MNRQEPIHEGDPAMAAWARDLGLPADSSEDEVLDALVVYARQHGLVERWSRTVTHKPGGGPHDEADRMSNAELEELRPRRDAMRTDEDIRETVNGSTRRGGGDGRALKATMNAYKALAEAHPDEWDTLKRLHRLELGLSEEPAAAAKKPSRLDVLREQLRELGATPKI